MGAAQHIGERPLQQQSKEIMQRDVDRGARRWRARRTRRDLATQRRQVPDVAPDQPSEPLLAQLPPAGFVTLAGDEGLRGGAAEAGEAAVGFDSNEAELHRLDGSKRDRVRSRELEVLEFAADGGDSHHAASSWAER